MGFNSVSFYNFRNLENSEINTAAENICFTGKNGQGKTNFLEAVYILCYGNSFRTRYDSVFIRENENEMSLLGKYSDLTETSNSISYILKNRKKEIRFNGKQIKDRKEIIHNIPCIVFAHDDIQYVNGAPEKRRNFFNQTISLFDISYLDTLRSYNRILKNRNILLKERKKEYLSLYDQQLAETGLEIIKKRKEIITDFNKTFSDIFLKVSDIENSIRIVYKPSWKSDLEYDEIISRLEKNREAETAVGTTLSGPHRDSFLFYVTKKDFTKIASTGQLRLISLALKTSQAVFYKSRTGKKPLVLLDDVLLELDKMKKIKFLESFPEYEQAFFTFLPDEEQHFFLKDAVYYSVDNGVIRKK